jgi:hypothetical protein
MTLCIDGLWFFQNAFKSKLYVQKLMNIIII